MSICSLLSSTVLMMRDGEGKVLTAGNMFYNNYYDGIYHNVIVNYLGKLY